MDLEKKVILDISKFDKTNGFLDIILETFSWYGASDITPFLQQTCKWKMTRRCTLPETNS